MSESSKSAGLLHFLRDVARLRRSTQKKYAPGDPILWFHELPLDARGCVSPFLSQSDSDGMEDWLISTKTPEPKRPSFPPSVVPWLTELNEADALDPERLPDLSETLQSVDEDGAPWEQRLEDCSEIAEAWQSYQDQEWAPWIRERARWKRSAEAYATLDEMRRTLEKDPEQSEIVLALGLLQWKEPFRESHREIFRHVVTLAATLEFNAKNGQIRAIPAADSKGPRLEADMLDHDRERLVGAVSSDHLDELELKPWDRDAVHVALTEFANNLRSDVEVDADALEPRTRATAIPSISFAPCLLLRQRRATAGEEVLVKLIAAAEEAPVAMDDATGPWRLLLGEGDESERSQGSDREGSTGDGGSPERAFFPLATNEEQRQILERLSRSPGVIVKGPPGTGKSHTIANLICHLLASGERILVTAHTAKALEVLREKLPKEIQPLCVTTLGSSREERELLDEGVRAILRKKDDHDHSGMRERQKIPELEATLDKMDGKEVAIDRALRESREMETHKVEAPTGYRGTAAVIARRLEEESSVHGWIPDRLDESAELPLDSRELATLERLQSELGPGVQALAFLALDTLEIPDVPSMEALFRDTVASSARARALEAEADPGSLERLDDMSGETLERSLEFLGRLHELIRRSKGCATDFVSTVCADLLRGRRRPWEETLERMGELALAFKRHARGAQLRVQLPDGEPLASLLASARDLAPDVDGDATLARPRPGFFERRRAKKVVRRCTIDGASASSPSSWRDLRAHLELVQLLQECNELWGGELRFSASVGKAVVEFRELHVLLSESLVLASSLDLEAFPWLTPGEYARLHELDEEERWRRAIKARVARLAMSRTQEACDACRAALETIAAMDPRPDYAEALLRAFGAQDARAWKEAYERRERIRSARARIVELEALVERLSTVAPQLAAELRKGRGTALWSDRVRTLAAAWKWAQTRGWITKRGDRDRLARLESRRATIVSDREGLLAELAARRAWSAFFDRLSEATRQSLTAYTTALRRIGKGTGKHAPKHRRTARQHLGECLPSIPAWIMPLFKLWETIEPQPGMFDTVIVDEASQAGPEALALFLLAKRLIVVGDDMQNSPVSIGVTEDQLASLIRARLGSFRFCESYRPETSLYTHAERTFGRVVSLREHFRCVPEIIRFSNELCYSGGATRLIPLRQVDGERLPPLRKTFLAEGSCRGEGASLVNELEARTLVDTLVECLGKDEYAEKSFGVIVLQGQGQVKRISALLAERASPADWKERRIRCGTSADFQGDERDVVFMSLVVAPDHRLRSLTDDDAKRRFNVAMSRGRDQVWLFHSVRTSDLRESCLRHRLLSFFENPDSAMIQEVGQSLTELERESRSRVREPGSQPEPYESWFEVDVAREILGRNYRVLPQYEVSGRRIDLVLDGRGGRIAVECDGEFWHGPETYQADMDRQRQLERAGWRFHRIRESAFYADREREIECLLEACRENGIEAYSAPRTVEEIHDDERANATVENVNRLDQEPSDAASREEDPPVAAPRPEAPGHSRETVRTDAAWESRSDVTKASAPTEDLEPEARPMDRHRVDSARAAARETTVSPEARAQIAGPGHADGQGRAPFSGYEGRGFPDPRTASSADVREAIHGILELDGPLTRESVYRLYVKGCPATTKAGSVIKQHLNKALGAMLRARGAVQDDELGTGKPDALVLRLADRAAVRERPLGERDLLEVPPTELAVLFERFTPRARDLFGMDDETLFRAVLEHYGVGTLSAKRRRRLEAALAVWRARAGALGPDG